jgi:hypothetical protein
MTKFQKNEINSIKYVKKLHGVADSKINKLLLFKISII